MKKPKFLKSIARSLGESMLRFGGATPAVVFGDISPPIVYDESCKFERMTYRAIFDKLSICRNSTEHIKKQEENKAHNEAYKLIQKLIKVNQKIEGDYLITWIDCKVAFFNQDVDVNQAVKDFLTPSRQPPLTYRGN